MQNNIAQVPSETRCVCELVWTGQALSLAGDLLPMVLIVSGLELLKPARHVRT